MNQLNITLIQLVDLLLEDHKEIVAKPVSIEVETFGTGKLSDEEITNIVEKVFDLRPGAIIRDLDLRRPLYRQTAAYGHFGRNDLNLPWEQLNKVDEIKKYL